MKNLHTIFLICCSCLFYFTNSSVAQDTTVIKKEFQPKYYLNLGVFRPYVATTIQINGSRGPGVVLSLEDNLGFSERPWLFRAEGTAKFTKRSGLALTFINLNRKQEWVADREVTIFDTTFDIGSKLEVFFNTTFIAASYKYSIFSKPTWDAGMAIGIRYLQIKTGVDLQSQNFDDYAESVSVPAPVPVLGLYGAAYLTERLRMRYNFDYFALSVKGTRGSVLDNRFALEYYFIKNLGIGASANFLSYQVKEVPLEKNFDGQIKYSLNGFSFFMAARF